MNTTATDFWLGRLAEAVENALSTHSERSRLAYLELARHYYAMHSRTSVRKTDPLPRQDEVSAVAVRSGRHDFGSVHDALMGAV